MWVCSLLRQCETSENSESLLELRSLVETSKTVKLVIVGFQCAQDISVNVEVVLSKSGPCGATTACVFTYALNTTQVYNEP